MNYSHANYLRNDFVDHGNHKGGTMTGGYGLGYVLDMYPRPFCDTYQIPFLI